MRIRSRIFQQVRVTDFAGFGGPDLAYNARELRLCAYWASQAKEAYCHLKTAPSCFAGSVRGHRADLSYPPRLGVFVGQASIRRVLLLSAVATAALETSEFLNHDERSLLP